jgi:hypothetical protein
MEDRMCVEREEVSQPMCGSCLSLLPLPPLGGPSSLMELLSWSLEAEARCPDDEDVFASLSERFRIVFGLRCFSREPHYSDFSCVVSSYAVGARPRMRACAFLAAYVHVVA